LVCSVPGGSGARNFFKDCESAADRPDTATRAVVDLIVDVGSALVNDPRQRHRSLPNASRFDPWLTPTLPVLDVVRALFYS
jgi:hypothetical protein